MWFCISIVFNQTNNFTKQSNKDKDEDIFNDLLDYTPNKTYEIIHDIVLENDWDQVTRSLQRNNEELDVEGLRSWNNREQNTKNLQRSSRAYKAPSFL